MKCLIISQNGESFIAGSNVTHDEMHNLNGSIFDIYSQSSDLLKKTTDDNLIFKFDEFQYSCDKFEAKWNDDLCGYVIIFNDGKCAQTQVYKQENRLHADYRDEYLERYTEYDDELNEEQENLIDDFVSQINRIKYQFS